MASDRQTDVRPVHEVVQSVVLDVLRRRLAGESLPDEQVIASCPELADPLRAELAKLQFICAAERAADEKSRRVGLKSTTVTASLRGYPTPGMLQFQCPHCREPFETARNTPVTEIVCSICGGHFSLADDHAKTAEAASLLSLAHFDLVERLGVGGFGSVWKARDRKLDRTVAVKIPHRGTFNNDDLEKLLREARAAAQLQHPNIVRVYEVGREGDSAYIVSDFVRGIPLNDWLTGQQPTMRQAAEICAEIADALQHAHDRGVVHRDLKPGNILIDGNGSPHLMDFGLARRDAGEVTVTMEGQVLGTPAYMSPEQAQGEAHTADGRSDIYSLGMILFELLTGELPFRGNPRMLMHQVIHDEPPSPRKFNASVAKDLETIALHCLQKKPEQRYQTAKQLADELRRYLAGTPILARPINRLERLWRWSARNRLVASLSLTTLAVLCLGLVVATLFGLQARTQSHLAVNSRVAAEKALGEAVSAREEALRERNAAMRSQYYALMATIPKQIDESRLDMARTLLAEAPTQYRGWEWGFVARMCNLDVMTIHERDEIMAASFSPDGLSFASAGNSGLCTLYAWPGGNILHTFDAASGGVTSLAFSADGRLLVTGHRDTIKQTGRAIVWNVKTGDKIRALPHTSGVKCVGFSRDGGYIATGGYDGTAQLWNASTGDLVHVLSKHGNVVKSLAFSPTADVLVTADKDGINAAVVWDYRKGEAIKEISKDEWGIESLAFSPDGKTLAIGKKQRDLVELWAADTWEGLSSTRMGLFPWSLAFSPDGNYLVCGSRNSEVTMSGVRNPKFPGHDRTFVGHGLYVNAVSFSPDGDFLLTGSSDGTAKVWSIRKKLSRTFYETISEGVWPHTIAVRFARESDLMAIATTEDQFIRIWDAETFEERFRLGPHKVEVKSIDLSRDGTKLVAAADGVRLWDLSNRTSRLLPTKDAGDVDSVAFSADGKTVAASCKAQATVWDIASTKIVNTINYGDKSPRRLCFSPNGKSIAATTIDDPGRLALWDLEQPNAVRLDRTWSQKINHFAFSPNAKQIAVAIGNSPVVLDAETGKDLLKLVGHDDLVTGISWTPDGQRVATVTTKGTVFIWDPSNGRELYTRSAERNASLYCVDFNGDGRHLVVGGRTTNSAGFVVLTAYPWRSDMENNGDFGSEKFFDSLKRQELQRLVTNKSLPTEPILLSPDNQ